jgi:hypothetical protein
MNIANPEHAKEYRDSMQQAALGFLQRHQGEHLCDDGRLFDRASQYLVKTLDVPVFMAPRLVHLAMSELSTPKPVTVLGIDWAAGDDHASIVLVDSRTGERAFIPRRILPSRFLASHTL